MKTFFSVSLPCKIHLKKYFQHLVLHVKYFLENCQKPYLIQANPSKNKSIATKYKLLLLPQPNHVNKIKPHYMNPIKSQILREKKRGGTWGKRMEADGSAEVGWWGWGMGWWGRGMGRWRWVNGGWGQGMGQWRWGMGRRRSLHAQRRGRVSTGGSGHH